MGNASFRAFPVDSFPSSDWVSGPVGAGVDERVLDLATRRIVDDVDEVGLTQALLVTQGSRIVREEYRSGGGPAVPLISWSIAKSITSALVGIAVGDGTVSLSDDRICPEWNDDARSRITLGDLLGMSPGLEWAEDYVDAGVSHVIEMLFGGQDVHPVIDENGRLDPRGTTPRDAAGYAASKPLVAEPGSRYVYSSGTTNIVCRYLAGKLGERPGESSVMSAFMRDRLFAPLGMSSASPSFDGCGTFVGSSYVHATARDYARFGLLHLADGAWNGVQLLPEGWVTHSATPAAHDPENGYDYGAHWWMNPADPGSLCAKGYEGQHLWVSSRRGVVVVRLGRTSADQAPALERAILDLVRAFPVEGA